MEDKVSMNRLMLMITIVEPKKAPLFTGLLQDYEVNMQFTVLGEGTADAKLLSYLGLNQKKKVVIFSVIKKENCTAAMATVDEKFHTVKDAKGICFTVPFSSMIGAGAFAFLSNNRTM